MDIQGTVTVRFPKKSYQATKVGAAQHKMRLQDFLEYAVLKVCGTQKPVTAVAERVLRFDEEDQRTVNDLLDLLEYAPDVQKRLVAQHIEAVGELFKKSKGLFVAKRSRKL